jgi:hypothetical protein
MLFNPPINRRRPTFLDGSVGIPRRVGNSNGMLDLLSERWTECRRAADRHSFNRTLQEEMGVDREPNDGGIAS